MNPRPFIRGLATHLRLVLGGGAIALSLLAAIQRWPLWLSVVLGAAGVGLLVLANLRQRRLMLRLEHERTTLSLQLERRINELFSLQELSYVLAESLQLERIVSQVARYALRFLQAEGSALVLVDEENQGLTVAAAEGSLRQLAGTRVREEEETLLLHAIRHERIEVGHEHQGTRVKLLGEATGASGAAAPLRAHGLTMGALLVSDHRSGPFSTEDLWLLSTMTTQVAVVLANSRLFELIRVTKEEWETAFNALAEGIAVVDGRGRVRRANHALARIVDIPIPALIGQRFWGLVVGEQEIPAPSAEAMRRGKRHSGAIVQSPTLHRTLRLAVAPLTEAGPDQEVVVLVQDVTEQQAFERQLIQSEKLAAVGQLVSGVAHELNNPLTSIAGLSELLLERAPAGDPDREHLRVVHEQATRAGRIVQNLLTFARKEPLEAAPCDLADVVTSTVMLMSHELKLRGAALQQDLPSTPVRVLGDRYGLQQVLLNLLTNASQAVGSLPEGRARQITIQVAEENESAVLRVQDSGAGVPAELVPQLFTPFFTTKEPGQGTGLGLSISYGIVESHGGRLAYAVLPGGGSEFSVTLPLAQVAERLPGVRLSGAAAAIRRKILVVDEDAAVQRAVSALFVNEGHEVEGVRGGELGLAAARSGYWDLVLADPRAPGLGGSGFVDLLLADGAGWKERLIAVPDRSDRPAVERLKSRGVAVVEKPFKLRELKEMVGRLLISQDA
ncbi:MAG TPA: ATP-binding protein [Gemmatimonadales bacterium]|nr:ATP-binding protein [Gemmatimonadales bacterium]